MLIYYWLVCILPLVQHPLWGQQLGPLTGFEYIGVLCLIYSILHIFLRGKVPLLLGSWETRFIFLLYLIAFFSALTRGNGIGLNNGAFIIYTSSVFLVFITVAVVDTLDRFRITALSVVGSYAFASLYVLREWQKMHTFIRDFRPGWMVGDSNYFATAAIFSIVLAAYFMRAKGPLWVRVSSIGCLLVTIVAVTLCASRGGFLGLAVASIFLVWRTKHRLRNLVLISALVVPLSLALPVSPLHRFVDSKADLGSTQAHLDAWTAGFKMIETHPFWGIGLGNFKPLMPLYLPPGTETDTLAHNMFIEVAAEMGLPALLIFVGIFCASYRTLEKLRKSDSPSSLMRECASALQAGLLGFAVAGCFVSAEYQKTSWMGIALIACLGPLARSQAETVETVILPNRDAKPRLTNQVRHLQIH